MHNPEHLMESKQLSKSELQQQNSVSSHLTCTTIKIFFFGGGGWIPFSVSVYMCGWGRHSFHFPLLKYFNLYGKEGQCINHFVLFVSK